MTGITTDAELDCVGLYCPMPIMKVRTAIGDMEPGQVLLMEADDPGAEADIPAWCRRTGNELLKMEKAGDVIQFYIKKG